MCIIPLDLLRLVNGGKTSRDGKEDLLDLLSSPLYFFPSPLPALFPPSPSLCPVFVLFVGQRSPVCGIHFQSSFCAGNPPGDAASLSQMIFFLLDCLILLKVLLNLGILREWQGLLLLILQAQPVCVLFLLMLSSIYIDVQLPSWFLSVFLFSFHYLLSAVHYWSL